MLKKYILFLTVTAFVLVMDQMTKAVVLTHMDIHASISVIAGFFSITHVRNPGAAFGFLTGAAPVFRHFFFLTVTVIAVLLILYYLKGTDAKDRGVVLSLSLILSGALGNLIDRVRFGEVVDFLDVYIGFFPSLPHWPAFNVADSAISVGAVILIWQMIVKRPG
ncbi:MAG: signal peptidase II [Deltaproteobacteria bacterium]|nr:signal peptidase II [Deltaproteobacteria bacterium]